MLPYVYVLTYGVAIRQFTITMKLSAQLK